MKRGDARTRDESAHSAGSATWTTPSYSTPTLSAAGSTHQG